MDFRVWIDEEYYPEVWEAENLAELLLMLSDAMRHEDMPLAKKLRIEPKHTITLDHGYDVHRVEVGDEMFARIVAGEAVSFQGQGFWYEDEGWLRDHWKIDLNARDAGFRLDNGAEFHGRWVQLGDGGPKIDLLSAPADPEWQVVASRHNRGALDDWVEYLCVRRRLVPELTYELAVCGVSLDDEGQAVDNHTLQPMTDNAVVDITDGGVEVIAARLEQLEWPESDLELVVRAIAGL